MNLLRACLLASLSVASGSMSLGIAMPAFSQVQSFQPVRIASGDYAYLVSSDSRSPINVRDAASTRAYVRHIGYAGDAVEVLDRSVENGYMWYFVRFTVSNATGWVRGDFIALEEGSY